MPAPARVAAPVTVVAGVDTHSQTHHVAVLDATTGARLGDREVPATPAGYAALLAFLTMFGVVVQVGIEGTGSYGAGLARHLRAAGVQICEVIRPKRAQRRRGKSDPIDAYAAAAQVLSGEVLPTVKDGNGVVEQIRVLLATRRSAVKARTAVIRQMRSILVTAPDHLRVRYEADNIDDVIGRLLGTRPQAATADVASATATALKRLARRYQYLTGEIEETAAEIDELVHRANPALIATIGIGTVTAAQLLVTAGDNPHRLLDEAAFAALCGVAPIPASSGKTSRHRLNRGGDRDANCALHQIALVRMSMDARTKAYAARRKAEGKTTRDILRCLKRALAREVWHLLVHPAPVPRIDDLRPLRQSLGITLQTASAQFNVWPARISEIERGKARDDRLTEQYRQWLTTRQNTLDAA